jgi:hypothetical protein
MTQIVMLTSLAGNGIDILAGDVCDCRADEADRFVTAAQARPFDAAIDAGRRVKSLHPETDSQAEEHEPIGVLDGVDVVVDMSQFPTAMLIDAETGVTQENVDALVAAGLGNFEDIDKASATALKKLDTIGAATVKKIRAGVEAIRVAALDAALSPADAGPLPEGEVASEHENTDEDDGEANEGTADATSGAEGQEA